LAHFTRYLPPVPSLFDTWFKQHILVHEAALTRYLNRAWPRRHEVADLRQEIYVRLYEATQQGRPANAKAFLFATARNLLTDRIRRARIVPIEVVGDPDSLNVMVDDLSPERRLNAWQELKRVTRALNRLPPKCREIVWLRKVDEMSNKEIADHLGLSVRTVEGQMLKGMRLLGDARAGTTSGARDEEDHGTEHLDSEGQP
jgi:RNA polymerase sigma-70 factor (ECF subfamily)